MSTPLETSGGACVEVGMFGREDKREESIDQGVVCFKG